MEMPPPGTVRHYDMDWLRSLVILLLIPFHTARIFDPFEANYVSNGQTSRGMFEVFIGVTSPWIMPLLFFLAGSATWLALERRSAGEYLAERVRRLLVPLVFGVLVVVPPQAYLGWVTHGGASTSYFGFLADYFGHPQGDLTGYTGQFTPAHLWFVLYLLIISAVLLPLLLFLRRRHEGNAATGFARFLSRPGALFLLPIPLTVALAAPSPGGKNIVFYALIFFLGYLFIGDRRLQLVLDRNRYVALGLGIVAMAGSRLIFSMHADWSTFSLPSILYGLLQSFNTWFWLVALVAFGRRLLNFSNRPLRYFSQASYPFYIIHQTVIVAIGYYIVRWNLGVWPKFLVIAACSFVVTMALYDLVIKRTPATRLLFGLRVHALRLGRSKSGRTLKRPGEV